VGEEGRSAIEAAGRTWARLFCRVPLLDGQSFRELVTRDGSSLLWLTETFIHRETRGPWCARVAETALRVLEAARPEEVDALALPAPVETLLARACTARGVLFHGHTTGARPLAPRSSPPSGRWGRLIGLIAPGAPPRDVVEALRAGPGSSEPLLVLAGPGAGDEETRAFTDAARAAGGSAALLRQGALSRFETRRVHRAATDVRRHLGELLARLRGGPGLHDAYAHRGVSFADLASRDLEAVLLGRLPDAVRLLEATDVLVTSVGPGALVLVDIPRDDRRCLLAAAARHHVPTLVVRTGEPDPDDVDRTDGGPTATHTVTWTPGVDASTLLARLAREPRASLAPA